MSAERMRAAGEVIARQAALLASAWSEEIPPDIKVTASDREAVVSSQVGPSYPNEVSRVRHPVFGHFERSWVTNEHRPFLAPAARAMAGLAAEECAKVVDDMCRKLGFEGTAR